MTCRSSAALLLLLFVLGCGSALEPAEEAPSTEAADAEAIRALVERFNERCNVGDLDGLMSLYADDAVRMPPNEPSWVGQAAILAGFASGFEQYAYDDQVENQIEEIQVSGDWGFARGSYSLTVTATEGVDPFDDGKWMAVFRRQPDGSWKTARDIYSSDSPPPRP